MNKKTKIFGFAAAFATFLFPMHAQESISSIMKAGVADMDKLAEGYLKPAGIGFSSGLGANWYNTAATHKLLGFDLTVGASVAMTPSSDQTFSLDGFKTSDRLLNGLSPVSGTINTAPTFGGSGDGVLMQLKQNGTVISQFTTPKGYSKYIPTPNLQLTLGLPLGNDLSVRFTPAIKMDGMSTQLWGVALKHDVKQWIPLVKSLPFDASVLVGYTNFSMDYSFKTAITPDVLKQGGTFGVSDGTGIDWIKAGQGFEIKANALTANLIVSKKLAFFTPYVGVGFTKANFDMSFTGKYPVLGNPITTPGTDFGKLSVTAVNDPINLSYSEFMPGATVGFRMKVLFVLALHAQYTVQKYPTASVGFGINIR